MASKKRAKRPPIPSNVQAIADDLRALDLGGSRHLSFEVLARVREYYALGTEQGISLGALARIAGIDFHAMGWHVGHIGVDLPPELAALGQELGAYPFGNKFSDPLYWPLFCEFVEACRALGVTWWELDILLGRTGTWKAYRFGKRPVWKHERGPQIPTREIMEPRESLARSVGEDGTLRAHSYWYGS